jgi:hypothetical protein
VKTIKSFFILTLLFTLGYGTYFYFHDTDGPLALLDPSGGSITRKTPITLTLNDETSMLAQVTIVLIQDGKTVEILNKDYPENTPIAREEIDLSKQFLKDGLLTLQITSRDRSIYHFGDGNTATTSFQLIRDTRPPLIEVLSTAHNLTVGGAGIVAYSIGEVVENSGVQIGDYFFPGHQQLSGDYLCLFTFPYDADPEEIPQVVAMDEAGNQGVGGFYYRLKQPKFKVDKIPISDRFLKRKMPQFQDFFPQAETPLEVFLNVNRILRPKNRAWLSDVAAMTSDSFEWSQSFLRQPGAATRATFGDRRHYFHNDKEIDQQTHLGIDLASIARAKVPATNSGTVVYTDIMGIYGQCIIIDHGLGLQTLYAHLSSMAVEVGDVVERGQIIGRTGATGLAGGDHLHYGIIVGGVPVNPIEWWDKNWVRNNITSKLQLSSEL